MNRSGEPPDIKAPAFPEERDSRGEKGSRGERASEVSLQKRGVAGRGVAGDICHRIKNDLQTMANLLALAAPYFAAPLDLAEALEHRVGAMGVPYTLVAENGAPPTLDRLAQEVARRSQWRLPTPLGIQNSLPDLQLSLRLCSPLSLWLHEVIVNALVHGLDGNGRPRLSLSGGLSGHGFRLSVMDNGHGMPQGLDWATRARFGLKVAQAVAKSDLRGHMDLTPHSEGLEARLELPAHEFERLNRHLWN